MKQLKITQRITERESRSLNMYFNEITQCEMITAEEEVELARRIRQGDDGAVDKLVKANLRFVVSVAKQYQHMGMSLKDLINEGNVGLITAARRFDETRGFKFISYAVWWIRQSILLAIAQNSRTVRLPQNKLGEIRKVVEASSRLEQGLGRPPTAQEVGEAMEIPASKVENFLSLEGRSLSLDAPLSDGEDNTLMEVLSNNEPDTDEALMTKSLSDELEMLLSQLESRERDVLRMHFGLGTNKPINAAEIATRFGITRERVRQIRERALRKLRMAQNRWRLQDYLS
ncbi:MAG TPA: sigma-70 family RNA polymerase sigma factor [Bacteroidetes bacterium]|nr:sigma-70 family RNA polymerase sigma factor [Bacteroidota bacterium]